jgi:hypothetical protein
VRHSVVHRVEDVIDDELLGSPGGGGVVDDVVQRHHGDHTEEHHRLAPHVERQRHQRAECDQLAGRGREQGGIAADAVEEPDHRPDRREVGELAEQLIGVGEEQRCRGEHRGDRHSRPPADAASHDPVQQHQPEAVGGDLEHLEAVVV